MIYMSKKQTTDFCSLKRWTLQTLVVSKSGHYKLLQSQKVDITNFSNLKKRTLQTFVVPKSGHHQLQQSQKADTTKFSSLKKQILQTFVMKKADIPNFSSGCPSQTYVNKNPQKCAPRVLFGLCCSLLYKIPQIKMQYGPCNISVHTPTISPSNICLEWDGWVRLTLDDLLTLTLTLQCKSSLCSASPTFVVFYSLSGDFVVQVRLLQSIIVYQ